MFNICHLFSVLCGSGSYFNSTLLRCVLCPAGTYRTVETTTNLFSECSRCPGSETTNYGGAVSRRNCHSNYLLFSTNNFCNFHVSSVMRWDVFPFQNNPKNVDPSNKMDLDFWDCFRRKNLNLQQNFIRLISYFYTLNYKAKYKLTRIKETLFLCTYIYVKHISCVQQK